MSKIYRYEGGLDKSIIIVGDFNTPLLTIDRTARQIISKDIDNVNSINQQDLIDIYRTLQLITAEYTFLFSSTHGTFNNITIPWVIKNKTKENKKPLTNLKELKSYSICSLAKIKLEINNKDKSEISKHLETKQHT